MRLASIALATLLAATLDPPSAAACDCFAESYRSAFRRAERVILVRVTGVAGDVVSADIIEVFKGKKSKKVKFEQEDNPLCGRTFDKDEVAFVFLFEGRAEPCAGNHAMAYQLRNLRAIAKGARTKIRTPNRTPVGQAVAAALGGVLHDRAEIPVLFPALSGKSFDVESTRLRFTRSKKAANAIVIEEGIAVGEFTYVRGKYDLEGVSFAAFVRTAKKTSTVLFSVATEN